MHDLHFALIAARRLGLTLALVFIALPNEASVFRLTICPAAHAS